MDQDVGSQDAEPDQDRDAFPYHSWVKNENKTQMEQKRCCCDLLSRPHMKTHPSLKVARLDRRTVGEPDD